MNEIYEALQALRKNYPPRKEQWVVVHTDDLLPLLRALRKRGYKFKRWGKRPVWRLFTATGAFMIDILVNNAATPGKFYIVDIPQPLPLNIRIDLPPYEPPAHRWIW